MSHQQAAVQALVLLPERVGMNVTVIHLNQSTSKGERVNEKCHENYSLKKNTDSFMNPEKSITGSKKNIKQHNFPPLIIITE